MPKANCQYRGSGGQLFATVIIHLIILSAITFGIYSAWAWVRLLKLKASHTDMNGKSVSFTGTGGQLFVLSLVQGLLIVITFGLYTPWAICALIRWKTRNTLVGDEPSTFSGTGGSLFFLYLIHLMILPLLTFGLYYFWGMRRFYGWKEEHTRYGGERTSFGAGVGGFLKVFLIGNILNTITLYLFSPWSLNMFFKWQINGLAVGDDSETEHFPPVKTSFAAVACLIVISLGTVAGIGYIGKNQFQNLTKNMPKIAKPRIDGGKKRTYKVPAVPKPPSTAARKPSTKPVPKSKPKPVPKSEPKPEPKPVPRPASSPAPSPPVVEPVAPEETVNYDSEMTKVNTLLKLDNKNQDALYNRAWLHAHKGDLELAAKDYSLAIAFNNKLEDAYFNRGLVYIKLNKFEDAVNDFTEVIKLNPASMDALCNRGNAYFKLGKKGLALRDYNAALRIDPNDADLYYNRGFLNRSRGQNEAAMVDFKKAASLGNHLARQYLNPPAVPPVTTEKPQPVPPETTQNPQPTSPAKKRLKPASVRSFSGNASGSIHGENFRVEKATLNNGILTLRQGEDFFPDLAVMIFLFLKDGESIDGKVYDVSREQGFGAPHIHMKWKEQGQNVPKTQIYMKDYIMRLEFGKRRNGVLPGKISLALPDENHSEVNGTFQAEFK